MRELIDRVENFHVAFGVGNNKTPTNLSSDEVDLRVDLINEETIEYKEAAREGDLVGIADALGDQLYIIIGTILRHGMQDVIEDVFNEIHRSNMSKLNEDGKPIINGINGSDPSKPLGKILKSNRYTPPYFDQYLDK